MLKINSFPKFLTESQIKSACKFSTATLCDAMFTLHIEHGGCCDGAIHRLTGHNRIAGAAYTVKTTGGNTLPIQYAICQGRPGYILVVDTGGYLNGPHLGDINALTAQYSGLAGIIIDGYIRDIEDIDHTGYPIFGRGTMPRKPSKDDSGEINGTIHCANLTIHPGDVIVGDADGVIAIPRNRFEDVLELAKKKETIDEMRKKKVKEFFSGNVGNIQQKDTRTLLSQDILSLLN